jgi:sugar (pentulose or hexulose) kinase
MVATYLVGIDIGTSGMRMTAYDTDGEIVLHDESDIETHTTEEWERALRDAALYLPSGRLVCTADGTSGTVICVDKHGEPVFPPQMYFDSAPEHARAILEHEETVELARRGISISATSPLPKILKLRDEHPDRFAEVEWIISPTTWLLSRLNYLPNEPWHEVSTDWTNALKFGADITMDSPTWYEPLFEIASLSLDLLPRIEAPGTHVGTAESDLAIDIGLEGAELYQGMTDGNASAMSAGCLEPGDYNIACESTSVVKYVSESIVPHEALYYHRHPIEGYLAGAAFESGVIFEWFCDRILEFDQRQGLELARAVPAGTEYEMYVQGNRSPFFEAEMANSVFGIWPDNDLSPTQAKGRLLRGIVTGIALAEYSYLPLITELFETGIDRMSLVGSGVPGGTDPFSWWNELRAAVWNRSMVQMEPRTTAGSLIPAALTASVFDNVETAASSLLRSRGVIEPDEQVSATYTDQRRTHFDRWCGVRDQYRSWKK